MRWLAPLALALALLVPSAARAGYQMRIGGSASRVDPERHPLLLGGSANWVIGPESWLSFQSDVGVAWRGPDNLSSLTFGPQLGVTDGRVRPYVTAFMGFLGGTPDFAGWVAGYSAGAVADVGDRVALWVDLRSVNSGNLENTGHLAQARLGVAFGSRAGRARRR